jgi:hypothetical protein
MGIHLRFQPFFDQAFVGQHACKVLRQRGFAVT